MSQNFLLEKPNQDSTQDAIALMMARLEKCSFCNSKLLFSHNLDLEHFEVIESARCSGCGTHTTPKKHSLQ